MLICIFVLDYLVFAPLKSVIIKLVIFKQIAESAILFGIPLIQDCSHCVLSVNVLTEERAMYFTQQHTQVSVSHSGVQLINTCNTMYEQFPHQVLRETAHLSDT